jgi:hypothetical protein
VLVLALAYLAIWRLGGGAGGGEAAAREVAGTLAGEADPSRVPWILILLYVATAIYMIFYVLLASQSPPTW